jgi:hypothetical protein
MAHINLTTLVSYYQDQIKTAPICVRNSTWLDGMNKTLVEMLTPREGKEGVCSKGDVVIRDCI